MHLFECVLKYIKHRRQKIIFKFFYYKNINTPTLNVLNNVYMTYWIHVFHLFYYLVTLFETHSREWRTYAVDLAPKSEKK